MKTAENKYCVMVLDDDDIDREAIVRVLAERTDIAIVEMETGHGALEVIQAKAVEPHIVIADLFMPNMDGLEFLRTLRKRKTDLPIVIVSGQGQRGKLDLLKMAGRLSAARVIDKQDIATDLADAVSQLLESPKGSDEDAVNI